jgi:hypothetical protein
LKLSWKMYGMNGNRFDSSWWSRHEGWPRVPSFVLLSGQMTSFDFFWGFCDPDNGRINLRSWWWSRSREVGQPLLEAVRKVWQKAPNSKKLRARFGMGCPFRIYHWLMSGERIARFLIKSRIRARQPFFCFISAIRLPISLKAWLRDGEGS